MSTKINAFSLLGLVALAAACAQQQQEPPQQPIIIEEPVDTKF
ncbi:MAG: hypothetical protein AAFX00_01965 [Pseudomonadota bacterium]